MYEAEGARLLAALHERWGDDPDFELRPNKDYGFYLIYWPKKAPLNEVRQLIIDLFGFATYPTVIIGSRE